MSEQDPSRVRFDHETLATALGCTKSYLSQAVRENWLAGGELRAPVAEWAVWNRKRTKVRHFSVPTAWLEKNAEEMGPNLPLGSKLYVDDDGAAGITETGSGSEPKETGM